MFPSSFSEKKDFTPSEVDLLKTLIEGAKEYSKVKEEEKTKREKIEADLTLGLQKIQAQRDVLEMYLRESFGQRQASIDKMFSCLDKAMGEGNSEIAIQAIASIEGVVKSSPLEGLLQTREALGNPDATFEL